MGNLSVNDIPTKVLFDSDASHSFLSYPFSAKHDLHLEELPKSLDIVSPGMLMSSR